MSHHELRAERLRVLLALVGEDVTLAADAGVRMELPRVSIVEYDLLDSVTAEDMALANACLAVGKELRAQQYRALEEYLALALPVDEELGRLPVEDFARAFRACHVSGWAWLPDEDDS